LGRRAGGTNGTVDRSNIEEALVRELKIRAARRRDAGEENI